MKNLNVENKSLTQELFVPKQDSYQVLSTGLTILIARKGCPMPMDEAGRLGLVGGGAAQSVSGVISASTGNTALTDFVESNDVLKNDSRQVAADSQLSQIQNANDNNFDLSYGTK